MANVLNPETESITLNTEMEIPTLEPATELEQPSFESTSNPETNLETAEVVEVGALDADAITEPVVEAATVQPTVEAAPTAEIATNVVAQTESIPEPVAVPAPQAVTAAETEAKSEPVAVAKAPAHEAHSSESAEDFSAALEAFERELAAEAASRRGLWRQSRLRHGYQAD